MMKSYKTDKEKKVGEIIEQIFNESQESTEIKLENFTKYVRRQHLKRFITFYEIYKRILPIKGSIVGLVYLEVFQYLLGRSWTIMEQKI